MFCSRNDDGDICESGGLSFPFSLIRMDCESVVAPSTTADGDDDDEASKCFLSVLFTHFVTTQSHSASYCMRIVQNNLVVLMIHFVPILRSNLEYIPSVINPYLIFFIFHLCFDTNGVFHEILQKIVHVYSSRKCL